MRKSSNLNFFIAFIAVTCLLSSCKWGSNRAKPRGKNIVCAVDFSDSKNASERLQFYMNVIKDNIIPKLGLNDKITVIPIDEATRTDCYDILLKDLSTMDFEPEQASAMEQEQITQNNLKNYKDTLVVSFVQNFQVAIKNRNKSSHGTDIFGALEIIKNSKLKPNDDNYLIFLSDMMNWDDVIKMEPDNKDFNSNTLEKNLGKIPNYDMPKVTSLVLTAEQVEVSPEHFSLVDSFWRKYFSRNHVTLYDYNSASVSKLNELMALPVSE
jgi:hypothetical protein